MKRELYVVDEWWIDWLTVSQMDQWLFTIYMVTQHLINERTEWFINPMTTWTNVAPSPPPNPQILSCNIQDTKITL